MKILVVDDDDIALAMVRIILMKERHEVVLAHDGEEALSILRHNDIRVVISDWNMPKMDGVQLCRRIREMPSLAYVYVIMVTSRSTGDDMLVGLWTGADDYITKPFNPVELLLRVRNAERIASLEVAEVTIFCLAKLAESKDSETGQHLERMRGFSTLLAEQMVKDEAIARQLSPSFPSVIHQTSPLHDIGKVGIPDSILLKPGSLNDDEWTIMKRHTEIGAETLDMALRRHPGAEILRIAQRHRLGAPRALGRQRLSAGLEGRGYSLGRAVVALANVYDALTARRVYKAAMPHDVARGIILQGTGNHFDPRVVEAFLAVEQKFIELQERLSEGGPEQEGDGATASATAPFRLEYQGESVGERSGQGQAGTGRRRAGPGARDPACGVRGDDNAGVAEN